MDDIMKVAPIEERIYRHRCVEAWSIVVPWAGYSLSALLKKVNPTPKAKYRGIRKQIRFERDVGSLAGRHRPSVRGGPAARRSHASAGIASPWACMAKPCLRRMARRCGSPCHGNTDSRASNPSSRSALSPRSRPPPGISPIRAEYGFYSNVNPQVDHPRWSQATERRLGEFRRRPTLMFNGYGDQVASLYNGMDLRKFY